MNLEMEAMALAMPEVDGHPNRLEFHGVLTLVGSPSRRAPSGANGHRVMLTRKATEAALPSLLGMALDYAPALDAHDARRKIGVITAAEIVPVKAEVAKSEVPQGLKPEVENDRYGTAKAVPLQGRRKNRALAEIRGKDRDPRVFVCARLFGRCSRVARGKRDAGDVVRDHGRDCGESGVADLDGDIIHVYRGGRATTGAGGVSGDVDRGGVKGNW